MTSQEEKVQRFLTGKKRDKAEPGATFQLPPILKMDWYLSSWIEKLLFVLGFFALIWTIFSLAVFGLPWN